MKFPGFTEQDNSYECGPATLRMTLLMYGMVLTNKESRTLTKAKPGQKIKKGVINDGGGAANEPMIDALHQLGFGCGEILTGFGQEAITLLKQHLQKRHIVMISADNYHHWMCFIKYIPASKTFIGLDPGGLLYGGYKVLEEYTEAQVLKRWVFSPKETEGEISIYHAMVVLPTKRCWWIPNLEVFIGRSYKPLLNNWGKYLYKIINIPFIGSRQVKSIKQYRRKYKLEDEYKSELGKILTIAESYGLKINDKISPEDLEEAFEQQ